MSGSRDVAVKRLRILGRRVLSRGGGDPGGGGDEIDGSKEPKKVAKAIRSGYMGFLTDETGRLRRSTRRDAGPSGAA